MVDVSIPRSAIIQRDFVGEGSSYACDDSWLPISMTEIPGHDRLSNLQLTGFCLLVMMQLLGESMADYEAALRRLATNCKFGEFLGQALRDRFVCGLRNEAVQRRLLSEKDLTHTKAMEIAQAMEAADRNAKSLKGTEPSIHQFVSQTPDRAPCTRCGRKNHKPQDCRFREAVCDDFVFASPDVVDVSIPRSAIIQRDFVGEGSSYACDDSWLPISMTEIPGHDRLSHVQLTGFCLLVMMQLLGGLLLLNIPLDVRA